MNPWTGRIPYEHAECCRRVLLTNLEPRRSRREFYFSVETSVSAVRLAPNCEAGRLVSERWQRPRYTLDELLAQCNPRAHRSEQEREHLADESVGRELI